MLLKIRIFEKSRWMETDLHSNYFQLLKLIRQLPKNKLERLINILQAELKLKQTPSHPKLKDLILNAPTWADEELAEYTKARDHINSSRLA